MSKSVNEDGGRSSDRIYTQDDLAMLSLQAKYDTCGAMLYDINLLLASNYTPGGWVTLFSNTMIALARELHDPSLFLISVGRNLIVSGAEQILSAHEGVEDG